MPPTRINWHDYELLDSGNGRKLERFGAYTLDRPDPQAIWAPTLPEREWRNAHAVFEKGKGSGRWSSRTPLPDQWALRFRELTFLIRLTPNKHTGVFPEQAPNWLRLQDLVRNQGSRYPQGPRILNLFGYTGGTTLALASAGAHVCHVDASKSVLRWARANQEASGLGDASIRWIEDDAASFVAREQRRGNRYDGIVMDPPPYGRGSRGKMWKLERNLPILVAACREILSPVPLFVLINTYATGYSHLTLRNLLADRPATGGGRLVSGDLSIPEGSGERELPCGIFAFLSGS